MHRLAGRLALGLVPLVSHLAPLVAQTWNDPAAVALIRRAVERRQVVRANAALTSYRTQAHGFVLYLAQVGEGLTEPPRLIKADELDVEVYWQAPDRSKQVIRAWRDGAFLPTDIRYHRDHLGIVTNNFGDAIRLGDGDEVRDAVHPLSAAGPSLYDYALGDSLAITTPAGRIVVYEVRARPREFDRPLVVGTLYLDAATAELVRFRFSFTAAAYRDRQVEDITVVLENSWYEQRHWLPYRQEIEIRRRTAWLDFPVRSIIRGRWEIDDYALNAAIPPGTFAGQAIGGLQQPQPGDSAWSQSLEQAIGDVATPINRQDMAALRVEVERLAGTRALGGLPAQRFAAGSLSDLARVNRVQGLTLGFGAVLGVGSIGTTLRPYVAYGTADDRVMASLALVQRVGATDFSLRAARSIEDMSDFPVIAPIVNSILAQETGRDYGDYVLLHTGQVGARVRLGGRTTSDVTVGIEESQSVTVEATPASGVFGSNPSLGAGTYRVVRWSLERTSGGIALRQDLRGRFTLEAGEGPTEYVRATMEARWLAELGAGQLLSRVYLGAGSDGLPAYRQFVFGGRGTLVGEPFRAFGGRSAAMGHVEWRLRAPIPALPLGSFASTGRQFTVAPFFAAGWSDRPVDGLPWGSSDGVRPVAGIAVEWFMRLLRIEAGVSLRTGTVGVTVDITRDWWGVL